MESLENKRKSNKNLIGHSKEKKQDLSVRTEEKIKTGNTEEKNHVDEIGSMVEGEVAKETVLPSWMCESEAYEPNIDKDGFITKSAQAILGVLAKLKWNAGKDRRFSASPSLKLCYTFLFILLTACSKNYLFSLIMVAGTILALASYPASAMKQILSGTIGAVLFSIFILLPAVFMGNPQILLTIGTKVFLSVTLIGMLSAGTAWNKLTASLRAFHIPDIFIFTLDITLKYIAVLGEICMEILTSLRLRSIGQNKKKAKAFSGILGISFLKSREMADEMYAAMCCRGFVGEYKTGRKYAFRKQDIFYIFSMIAVVGLFGGLEVYLRIVELLTDRAAGEGDDLRRGAGLPAKAQRRTDGGAEVGKHLRQIHAPQRARKRHAEHARHLQKRGVRAPVALKHI